MPLVVRKPNYGVMLAHRHRSAAHVLTRLPRSGGGAPRYHRGSILSLTYRLWLPGTATMLAFTPILSQVANVS